VGTAVAEEEAAPAMGQASQREVQEAEAEGDEATMAAAAADDVAAAAAVDGGEGGDKAKRPFSYPNHHGADLFLFLYFFFFSLYICKL
jgi:hypothetical protein